MAKWIVAWTPVLLNMQARPSDWKEGTKQVLVLYPASSSSSMNNLAQVVSDHEGTKPQPPVSALMSKALSEFIFSTSTASLQHLCIILFTVFFFNVILFTVDCCVSDILPETRQLGLG